MRDVSDQFVKNLLRDALNLATTADTEVEVLGSTQKIDVYSEPDPAREAMRAEMGLLGELAAERSLFEPFHDTPGVPHFRRCIRKQLAWHHELERRARVAAGQRSDDAESEARGQVQFPALVIGCAYRAWVWGSGERAARWFRAASNGGWLASRRRRRGCGRRRRRR